MYIHQDPGAWVNGRSSTSGAEGMTYTSATTFNLLPVSTDALPALSDFLEPWVREPSELFKDQQTYNSIIDLLDLLGMGRMCPGQCNP